MARTFDQLGNVVDSKPVYDELPEVVVEGQRPVPVGINWKALLIAGVGAMILIAVEDALDD